MLGFILFFTFISSIASLLIVSIFLVKKSLIKKISFNLVAFAAGALLATGITDTLPEAVKRSNSTFVVLTLSIALFFVIERVFLHLHHHEAEEGETLKLPLPFLLFGDGLHNFIDGISLASTFLVSFPLGVVTAIAIFVHEIPHELGDFGILIHMGFKRGKALLFNLSMSLPAFLGAFIGFFIGNRIEGILPILLTVTSANFIYLSLSDLLPELYEKAKGKSAVFQTFYFLLGVLFILVLEHFLKA
ncbi:ZIP family metal transporter [Patescibacteria group bacterium]|nr:ZIP family metal transporter [Patescibacteria group bacterium]